MTKGLQFSIRRLLLLAFFFALSLESFRQFHSYSPALKIVSISPAADTVSTRKLTIEIANNGILPVWINGDSIKIDAFTILLSCGEQQLARIEKGQGFSQISKVTKDESRFIVTNIPQSITEKFTVTVLIQVTDFFGRGHVAEFSQGETAKTLH